MKAIVGLLLMIALGGFASMNIAPPSSPATQPAAAKETPMELGNFSVSLTVKDLQASRAFYEKLGFRQVGGDAAQNWLVLQNSTAVIGLFQGMFERNMLTFNPGWDRNRQTPASFDDVRDLQKRFKELGLALALEADPASTGPASLMLNDPDGNPILIDQHVPKPGEAQR